MKIKKLSTIFILMMVLLVFVTLIYKRNYSPKKYFEDNGILLSITDGNGNPLSSVPDKDLYEVTVNCIGAEGSWDYDSWKIVFKNITGSVTCDLSFSEIDTSQTFAQYIASLAGTTQGNGQVVNENGYRYEGKAPNNYVWFNNELWQIIGVFGSTRHGVTNNSRTINGVSDTYLVKIIRAESIGGYVYYPATNGASNGLSNWKTSYLFYMLNGCYYNSLKGTDTTDISGSSKLCSNYCYGYNVVGKEISNNCDFSGIGIHNTGEFGYHDMVQTVTWYLGGPGAEDYDTYYPDEIYSYETNSRTVPSGGLLGNNDFSVTAGVGLMYLSDYAYSTPASSCTRGSCSVIGDNMYGYSSSDCSGNSWIYGQGDEWIITPCSDDITQPCQITRYGRVYTEKSYYGASVRPTVYLRSRVYLVGGTGTPTDPYIITKGYEYENTFNYSANVQTVEIAKAGYYKLEVYGGQGGSRNSSTPGGSGGYATGVIHLNKNDVLYIHTGGQGGSGSTSSPLTTKDGGGTNGGGNAAYRGGAGGGATDIRINTDSLYARVIVAGGGGGSYYYSGTYKAVGGAGGGTSGTAGSYYDATYIDYIGGGATSTAGGSGGVSTSGGTYNGSAGTFGVGGDSGQARSTSYYAGGAGGGGWYGGGGAATHNSNSRTRAAGGGGGSSYTYSSSTASQYPSGCLLNSNYYMTSTSTTAGSNSGNGYAIVTYCGQSASDCS